MDTQELPHAPGLYWMKINTFLPRIKVNLYREKLRSKMLSIKYKNICIGKPESFIDARWEKINTSRYKTTKKP